MVTYVLVSKTSPEYALALSRGLRKPNPPLRDTEVNSYKNTEYILRKNFSYLK